MEKTFRKMTIRASVRHAYVEAEVATALAHQIRVIRQQRGWTQQQLAKRMGTTQAAISRLEDPSYARITLRTLFDLSKVFDTGLQVRFVSTIRMLRDTWKPDHRAMRVESFEDEAPTVGFVTVSISSGVAVESITTVLPAPAPSVVALGGRMGATSSEFFAVDMRSSSKRAAAWTVPLRA